MIIDRLDLEVAVTEGLISRDQAVQLRDLSARVAGGDHAYIDFSQDTRDEPFRLLRGFRDVFIAIGVVIFAIGLSAIALPYLGISSASQDFWIGNGALSGILITFGLCAFGLAQAEFITRKSRLPLSSLVVAMAFAVWSASLFGALSSSAVAAIPALAALQGQSIKLLVYNSAVFGALLGFSLFYWRYRLPSVLFLLAGSIVILSLQIAENLAGRVWFVDHIRLLIGLWGAAIFVTAMWFDLKDRLRVSRFSECAFWLHLIAAPMMVHAILFGGSLSAPKFGFVLGTMVILSAIALVIDRRALLVSGFGYLTATIAQLVASSAVFDGREFAITAFILGAIIMVLGLGWTPIRRATLAALPFEALKPRLPPTVP